MSKQFFSHLEKAFQQKGFLFSSLQMQMFEKHYELLLKWNEKINLTSIIEPESSVWLHFIDSLLFMKTNIFQSLSSQSIRIADIGSGAGFPGLVLAIAYPNWSFSLFDSNRKKSIFLQNVIDELEMKNVKAFHQNIKEYIQQKKPKFNIALARAFMPWPQWCEIAKRIITDSGYFFIMFGRNPPAIQEISKTALFEKNLYNISEQNFELEGVSHQRTIFSIEKMKC